jgi:hypothetical protein
VLNRIARNLLSVLVMIILGLSSGLSQAPMRLLDLPAGTAQKLQTLLDEDALGCCHRAYLHQEQKRLSDRPLPDKRSPILSHCPVSADFSVAVSSLRPAEKPSRQSRAPPLSVSLKTT